MPSTQSPSARQPPHQQHPSATTSTLPGSPRQLLMWIRGSFVALLLLGGWLSYVSYRSPRVVNFQGPTMGTTYAVSYIPPHLVSPHHAPSLISPPPPHSSAATKPITAEQLQNLIEQWLQAFNNEVSTYIPTSQISAFNHHPDLTPFPVGEHFFRITEIFFALHQLSAGALDPTLGPLINLWGFGEQKTPTPLSPPSTQDIHQALQKVGLSKLISLQQQDSTFSIQKHSPHVSLNLSAIAKGYAVDRIADILQDHGIHNYLVNIGGDLRAQGKGSHQKPWNIGIETPSSELPHRLHTRVQRIVILDNKALATSGDYKNFFIHNRKRYSHIIDPRTGSPITHHLASVSVLADHCSHADGLATAFFVMGPQQTLALANRHNIPVLMMIADTPSLDSSTDAAPQFRLQSSHAWDRITASPASQKPL